MPKMFISNQVLIEVLEQATEEERLSLTKILDKSRTESFSIDNLQNKISEQGGHSIINLFRG